VGIVKTVDQCLCGFEIGSFETLAEPIVDGREKRNRLCGPIAVAQQPGEARSGAQFPGQGALPARPTKRLLVVIFGRRRGFGRALQQKSSPLMRSNSAIAQRSSLCWERTIAASIAARPPGIWPARPKASARTNVNNRGTDPAAPGSAKAARSSGNPMLRSPRWMTSIP